MTVFVVAFPAETTERFSKVMCEPSRTSAACPRASSTTTQRSAWLRSWAARSGGGHEPSPSCRAIICSPTSSGGRRKATKRARWRGLVGYARLNFMVPIPQFTSSRPDFSLSRAIAVVFLKYCNRFWEHSNPTDTEPNSRRRNRPKATRQFGQSRLLYKQEAESIRATRFSTFPGSPLLLSDSCCLLGKVGERPIVADLGQFEMSEGVQGVQAGRQRTAGQDDASTPRS
jgi:hypothetical protein